MVCPQCKGNFPIIEGSPFMSANGRGAALERMKTACGAELIASQNLMKADDGFGDSRTIPVNYAPTSFSNSDEKSPSQDNHDKEEKQFQYTHYFILELSIQVQRFFKVNFIRCFPA